MLEGGAGFEFVVVSPLGDFVDAAVPADAGGAHDGLEMVVDKGDGNRFIYILQHGFLLVIKL